MLRQIVFAIALLSGPSAAAQSPALLSMGNDFIGPLKEEWTQSDVLVLGLPYTRKDSNIEGDPVTIYTVKVDGQNEVSIWFLPDGASFDLATDSPAFHTKEGAHIGNSLADLKKIYPRGKVFIGQGETFVFRFFPWGVWRENDRGPHAAFEFDTAGIIPDCFDDDRKCPDLSAHISRSFTVSWLQRSPVR